MPHLHLIAHNIRSRENVGALFRTADSLGVSKLWLAGYTPCPPDGKISKVALGAEASVPWEQRVRIEDVMIELKAQGVKIFALELAEGAVELTSFQPPGRMAFLLGSETEGVPPSLIEQCDGVVSIKQHGMKESLNVTIAAAVASWAVLNRGA
jgi:tRNA G18 (ribose-2'-O)-methylase SpoU